MTVPDFVSPRGDLTLDGERLIAWIEAQFAEADRDNDLDRLNRLSGYLAYYYVNVHKLRAMTPAQWLQEHLHSGALAAWRDMQYLEEVTRQTAEQQEIVRQADSRLASLTEQLEMLRQELAAASQRIADLEASPARGKRGKRQPVSEAEGDAGEPEAGEPEEQKEEEEAGSETTEKAETSAGEA